MRVPATRRWEPGGAPALASGRWAERWQEAQCTEIGDGEGLANDLVARGRGDADQLRMILLSVVLLAADRAHNRVLDQGCYRN